jgi:hypothetical protein
MKVFEKPGEENTEETFALARERAEVLGIDHVVVATTTGRTGAKAAWQFKGRQVVVVTHSTGFSAPGVQELDPERRDEIEEHGACILTATHAFGGVGRAVRRRFQTYQVDEIIAQTLRLFGQGTKVCVEIAIMAADAGLVPVDLDVIAIAGSAGGADTAMVVRPAHVQDLFELKVRELICKA